MRACVMRAIVAGLVLPAAAAAQTVSITEADALAALRADGAWAQAAQAGVAVARAGVLAAARWPNPRVTYNRESAAGVAEDMVLVTQPLPVTGRRGLETRAATARVAAVEHRADERVRRIRADLRLAFTALWAAQARERERRGGLERLAGLARILERREAAGEAAGFDRLRAEREAIEVEADRAAAAAERARAQALLAQYLAAPPPAAALEAVRPETPSATLPPLDELIAHAERTRGDVQALRDEIEAETLAVRAGARSRIPEPDIIAGTKSSSSGRGDPGGVFGIQVALPLFDRARPEVAAAEARRRQHEAEAVLLRRTVGAQVAAWHAEVVERRALAARYRAAVSANAGEVERIAQVSYDAGEAGILELLDAVRSGASARERLIALEAAARAAEIELEYVSGWEIP